MRTTLGALFALLALLGALAGCSLPPYNEELSLSLVTKSKMQLVASGGPVHAWLDDNATQAGYFFLPARNDPAIGGFFATVASYGMKVWFLKYAEDTLYASWAIGLENANDRTNNYLLQPIESVSSENCLSLVRYLASGGYAANDMTLVRALDPFSVGATTSVRFDSIVAVSAIAVGSNIYPDSVTGSDRQFFLCKDETAGTYAEVECMTSETSGVTSPSVGTPFTLSVLPSDLKNAFYFHNPSTGKSYLSYWSGSAKEYRSWSWTPVTTPPGIDPPDLKQLVGIKDRIDAVLTTGQLLSFADGACTVYSAEGSKQHRFPLGGLHFCYERWDPTDSTFKLYFSLAYWMYGEDEVDDKLFFETYAIPTADLAKLD
jgi:hypothetical protein